MSYYSRPYNRFSSMGPMSNQSSLNNNMNNPNNANNQNQQQGFRQEYQGVLQGMQSLMTISYASVQLYSFGKIFMDMTKNILNYIKSSTVSAFNKVLYLLRIKQFLRGEIKLHQIGKAAFHTSKHITRKWVKLLQLLLLVVIFCSALVLYQVQRKLQFLLGQVEENNQNQNMIEVIGDEEQRDESGNIRQQDFWAHKKKEDEPQEVKINYLSDLPQFQSATKPWK